MVEKKKKDGFGRGISANELLMMKPSKEKLGEKSEEKKKVKVSLTKLRSVYAILIDEDLPKEEEPEEERKLLITAIRKALK